MAGITPNNWTLRSRALGCVLIAAAALLRGTFVSGLEKWSPRKIIVGTLGGYTREDDEQSGSLYEQRFLYALFINRLRPFYTRPDSLDLYDSPLPDIGA